MRLALRLTALFALLATSASAQEAESTRITIRCGTATTISNQPLIVVDGVVAERIGTEPPMALQTLSPDDVVDIEVLQNGEATRRYGAAAQNGVIVITTRHAQTHIAPPVEGVALSDPFPNPVAGGTEVTFRAEAAGPVHVDVFDSLGRRVWGADLPAGPVAVPTAGLAAGAYVVRVSGGGEAASRRFTVR